MIKKHIPNFITSLNLLSGCVAVYFGFQGDFNVVLIAVLLAAVFDFLDGFAARLLKAYSPMGKELDSLADMVSFGLAPGVVAFSLLSQSEFPFWIAFAGFIIPVFSALRLAKFNIDERQTTSFIGLPTPANAIFWVGFAYSFSKFAISNSWIILVLILFFSFFLVAEIPMFSMKIKNLRWKENQTLWYFLIGCVALLGSLKTDSFSLIIVWYIFYAVGINLAKGDTKLDSN